MKNLYLSIILILILIISNVNVIANNNEKLEENNSFYMDDSICFSSLLYEKSENYILVRPNNTNSFLLNYGMPILPVFIKTYKFPTSINILDINITYNNIILESIPEKIIPSPKPLIKDSNPVFNQWMNFFENESIYSSSDLYPDKWYDYNIGRGLYQNNQCVFLTVKLYPIRYIPTDNLLYIANDFNLKISYEETEKSDVSLNKYDMVIITPRKFSLSLLPLVRHKNNIGVPTFIKTTERIYSTYEGRDKPEQIKYFIKDAIENYGVKYVLLLGGLKNQRNDWYIPVRRTNNDDGWETGYISDLYYADIYDSNGDFSSWDSNGNDIFAEWNYDEAKRDIIDYYPDVYVGRLACRNKKEVRIVVDKIIQYEKRSKLGPWNNKMLIVGGDTFPAPNSTFYEGEIETNKSASFMIPSGFRIEKLWASEGTLDGLDFDIVIFAHRSIIKTFNRGVAFVHFAGHGNPFYWGTHPPQNYDTWIDGIRNPQMENLNNFNKLPIVMVGGCHNSQFNVTIFNIINDMRKQGPEYFDFTFWTMNWVPRCFSWKMISVKNGGAIATIGNTGLGYGYPGDWTLNGLSGWIEPRFFYNIGIQGRTSLGESHSKTISDYIDNFDVNSDRIDRKTIEQWVLLGDPSLNIG